MKQFLSTSSVIGRLCSLMLAGVLVIGLARAASAAGTAANTNVNNSATIAYTVGGVTQTDISASAAFFVDRKVNLTVTQQQTSVTVTPHPTNVYVLAFTVLNSGNAPFDFNLSAVDLNGAAGQTGTDNANASTIYVRVEGSTTPDTTYQSGEDTLAYINALPADATIRVYLVAEFNAAYSNGDIASYYLLAEARESGSAGVTTLSADSDGDNPAAVEDVFADGAGPNDSANDAQHSDYADYVVQTANLTVTKASAVISDGVNTSNFLSIPGAIVEYTITISNAVGAETATITVSDSLATEIGNGTLAYNAGTIQLDGVAQTDADDSPTDESNWNSTTNIVTVNGITLAANTSAIVKFRVTIQ